MSLGTNKLFASETPNVGYGLFITPSSLSRNFVAPGVATSNTATGNTTGGVGPFTYLWEFVSGDSMTINSSTSISASFTTSGSEGVIKEGTYRLTSTDIGNSNATASSQITVIFIFAGTPL